MKRDVIIILAAAVMAAGQSFWTPRKLIGSYPNWDYWWLNVRLGIDQLDTLYCAVARYNYSSSDPEFDLYLLNTDGDTVRVTRPWHGYEYQPIVRDGLGRNLYIGQPVLGMFLGNCYHMDAGVTDDSNCVMTTNSQGNDTIYFTRLGPEGQRLVWRQVIYNGDPWVGRTSLAIDPRGWLHMTTEDGMSRALYGLSTDKGMSWTWDTLSDISVTSHVRVVTTPDTCVHILFRTWTSGVQLRYMKLRPDGTLAVGPSVFAQGPECWDPNVAVDTSGNLRVVYIDGATNAHNLYYTVLRGNLDRGGQPVPDSELTLVPDTIIQYDPVRLAGPKVCVDARNRAQVVFEQGIYGSGGDKFVYHIREDAGPGVEEATGAKRGRPLLGVAPNPLARDGVVRFVVDRTGPVRLELYDGIGRRVRLLADEVMARGGHSVRLERQGLAPGTYLLRLTAGDQRPTIKMVVAE